MVTLLFNLAIYSQVGIGIELPHESAVLQIQDKENNKGLLIPEVGLVSIEDKSVIKGANPKEGLVVFNTQENLSKGLSRGFYYWGGESVEKNRQNKWNRITDSEELNSTVLDNQLFIDFLAADLSNNTTKGFSVKFKDEVKGTFNESLTRLTAESRYYHELVKIKTEDENQEVEGENIILIPAKGPNDTLDESEIKKGYRYNNIISQEAFVYLDELGAEKEISIKQILAKSETLTSLVLTLDYFDEAGDSQGPALVYKDEMGNDNPILLANILESSETLTSLEVDINDGLLIYTDEEGVKNEVNIDPIFKSAWMKSNSNSTVLSKADFGDDIYTKGWVGIGYDVKTVGLDHEKLRVNGSITAVNSYYADYVFDAYFNGVSDLKYDYNFKKLDEIESFIKHNNHLPGIKSITELSLTENGYSFNMSELTIQILEKTEELFLYLIEQKKSIDTLQYENDQLRNRLDSIERRLEGSLSKYDN